MIQTSWIKLLYLHPTASIRTNSRRSRRDNLHCGTRQGCPLSPMLFDIAIEPLATALLSCKDISGIWRGDIEHKVSLYAADLLLIQQPLYPILSLLSQFGKLSGYKLNLNKSELFPINNETCALDLTSLPFRIENNNSLREP